MVAAVQEQDAINAEKCALSLFRAHHQEQGEDAAFRVSCDFVSVGLRFVPVPSSVIDDILTHSAVSEGASSQSTFH